MTFDLNIRNDRSSSMIKIIGHSRRSEEEIHMRNIFSAVYASYETRQRYGRLKSRHKLETVNK